VTEDELNLHRINTIAAIDMLIFQLRTERRRLTHERTDNRTYNSGNLADYGDKPKPEKD
jgi:hypothetical protein